MFLKGLEHFAENLIGGGGVGYTTKSNEMNIKTLTLKIILLMPLRWSEPGNFLQLVASWHLGVCCAVAAVVLKNSSLFFFKEAVMGKHSEAQGDKACYCL